MSRTRGDACAVAAAVKHAIAGVDPDMAPYGAAAMDRYYSDTISRERIGAAFMLAFGSFGLLLAALGVYGVMAFSVSERRAEIGIRLALGAQAQQIVPMIFGRALSLVAAGVGVGLGGAVALDRVLASVLAEAGPVDGVVLGGAAALILVSAAAACLVPALAAARVDPAAALANAG